MNPNRKLLNSDIRFSCGDTYFARGLNYFAKEFVRSVEILEDSPLSVYFESTVNGSRNAIYQQEVEINWSNNYNSAAIYGDCSCPVGINCKHVAAACLAFQSWHKSSGPAQNNRSACLEWLNKFNPKENNSHFDNEEFIAYLLKPSNQENEVTVSLVVTKEKKTGGYTKGRTISYSNLLYGYAYETYIQPEDQEIARLLSALDHRLNSGFIFNGSIGYLALSKLIQTGRLFWKSQDHSPLKPGCQRDLKLSWQQNDHGDMKLEVHIEPPGMALLTDPPQYIDTADHIIGPLEGDKFPESHLRQMISAPLIPSEAVEEFSERLVIEHPDIPLPPPKKVAIIELEQSSPTPRLLLFGKEIPSGYIHLIGVSFEYGEWQISPTHSEEFSIQKTSRGLFRIHRDLNSEFEAQGCLTELGFAPFRDQEIMELIFYSPANQSVLDSADRWKKFIEHSIPALENEGWKVDIDNSFLLEFQEVDHWAAEIEETANEWFDMHFNVEVEGKSLPLLPLIMPVLEVYEPDNLPQTLTIPVEQHAYLTLPGEKIKPFLDILYELFDSSTLDENGTLTLSRFDAAALADVEARNDGIFSIRGGDALRALGQKLKDFIGIQQASLPDGLRADLRNYQQHGLNWLQFLREYHFAGILADDMGLGKTLQTLTHLLLEKESGRMNSPSLVIAPTSLMSNWRREAERFTPDLKILTLQGPERSRHFDKLNEYDLILTTYPLLPRDEKVLLDSDYYYLVLDEAHIIKNPKAKASRVVRKIKAAHRLCLTGTPMENHLGELWAQFDFLMPGFLGDSQRFRKIYRTPIETNGDTQQRSRLARRVAPFMLRRTKQEVEKELPPKTEIIRSVPLYAKQASLYESIRISMEKKVRETIAQKGLSCSHITILDALLKLRQTCCDPRTLSLNQAQKVNESAKLDLLMEMLPELLEEGRRILLFSQFTRMIALIEDELNARKISYTKLTGQTRKREQAIERFKNGEADVFLISLKAGGVGLNLTEADTVIIYDPWWNPAAESQAADRAHRIGQEKPVFVYKLLTENTVEEKILALQEKKRALADGVYRDGSKDQTQNLSADDLTALFEPLAG